MQPMHDEPRGMVHTGADAALLVQAPCLDASMENSKPLRPAYSQLRSENADLQNEFNRVQAENESLRAENNRLREGLKLLKEMVAEALVHFEDPSMELLSKHEMPRQLITRLPKYFDDDDLIAVSEDMGVDVLETYQVIYHLKENDLIVEEGEGYRQTPELQLLIA